MLYVQAWDNLGQAPEGWGSHIMLLWREFEPRPGVYDYALAERALNRRDRPCFLQIGFSMYDKAAGAPVDYTPAHHKRSIALTAANGKAGYVPDYSPAWTAAYNAAVAALAERFRAHDQAAGYWHAAGWSQETQAAVNNGGGRWADLLKPLLAEDAYLTFIRSSTDAARLAWGDVPVYLPGAPSPGGVWGHRRRDVIADLLSAGAGYMNCGLLPDNDTSVGIGGHAGLGMYDIVQGRAARVGFEEGPRKAYDDPGELYWMLLRAAHHGADFVNLYGSLSAPQAAQVIGQLPAAVRWLVFRGAEYPAVTYTGSGGVLYGHSGEPGCWGQGLLWDGAGGQLIFDAQRWDEGRWRLRAGEPIALNAPDLPDGAYGARITYADGGTQTIMAQVVEGAFRLPAASTGLTEEYHRVDLDPTPLKPVEVSPPEVALPLPMDEAEASATKVRYWLEQEAREREAGNTAHADEIMYSNIDLAYRLEGVTR